ncbi:cytochrome P450 2U1-like isoform X2 [Lineus longissimus]|uniref:cytochrome P450 2U1-like isoform X2 n=1 Tax=Lineus longissimus TaxID=88925 RepID=UPI002B4CD34F
MLLQLFPDFSVQTSLVFLLVVLASWFILREWLMTKNLPPGPKGLVAAIIDNLRNGAGVLGSNGQAWKEQRRFTLSVLRDFGMGKIMIQEKIQEEATGLLRELEQYNNKNIDLKLLLTMSVSNIICSIVFGQRYEYNDDEFRNCLKMVNFSVTKARLATLATDVFPFLQYLPGDLFHIKKIRKNQETLMEYFHKKINEHKDSLDQENIRSFIDAYLVEIEKRMEVDPNTTFTDAQLRVVISDLFIAGSETTASTLRFAILFMILNPDIQEKVQAEIDEVIGGERKPNTADRTKMQYTEAVLMEIQRAASIVPFGAPHGNTQQDIELEGYTIPRKAIVMSNLYAVHHDKTYWPYPDTFNPKNFLDEKGNVVHNERLIPFLIGRRSCPGESLAKMELFIFFTAMLQRFSFSVPEGSTPPSSDGILSITLQPKPHEVHISLRSDQ